jgi:transposase
MADALNSCFRNAARRWCGRRAKAGSTEVINGHPRTRSDWTVCKACLQKQQKIDQLEEELRRVKAKLRYQERTAKEGPFGSSTPSSKVPLKANSLEENQARKGGATPGHPGHGRQSLRDPQVERTIPVHLPANCPDCGTTLESRGMKRRTVLDGQPLKAEKQLLRLEVKRCPKCRKTFRAKPPGVLPKGLFSNRLLSLVAVEHYVHGLTLGQLRRHLGIGYGALIGALHGLARRLQPALPRLIREYRTAFVKHADETGWRTDGRGGYAWLFCTPSVSLFRFRSSRSAQVAHEVLGTRRLPGTLVVDRYNAYNKAPCPLQYCYSHLSRDIEDLQKDDPDNPEVSRFVETALPQLAAAMSLRQLHLSKRQFRQQASDLRHAIEQTMNTSASHPGIQHIQDVFREKSDRMYRWALDPRIPAENNRAERELRPLVIARKVSFGSQSDAGALTREVLMSVLLTLQKKTQDPVAALTAALNVLACKPDADVYQLLFDPDTS